MNNSVTKKNVSSKNNSNNKNNIENLIKDKGIVKTFFKLSIPLFILFVADATFYLIDTWMIVHFVDNAELIKGVLFSYWKFFTSFTLIFIIGTSIHASYSLGKNKSREEIARSINNGIIAATITAIICYTIMMATTSPYLQMIRHLSSSQITNSLIWDAQRYMIWFGFAQIIAVTRNSYSRILRIDGNINFVTTAALIVYPIAIFFNWIFMGVLNFGMSGAGISYFIATLFTTILIFGYIIKKQKTKETIIIFNKSTFKFSKVAIFAIATFGLATTIWNIGYNTNEMIQSIILAYMSSVGQNFLPLFTAYQLMLMFLQNVSVTITTVIGMLIGFMIGKNMKQESKKLMKLSMWIIIGSQALMTMILIPLFGPMSGIFNFEYSKEFFLIWITVIITMAILSSVGFMSAFLVATGNGKIAIKDNFIKFFLIAIPLQLIFFFGLYLPLDSSNSFHYFAYMWAFAGLAPIYLIVNYRKKYKQLLN